MANTYHRNTYHLVFGVKYRMALIQLFFKAKLINYVSGILREAGCIVLKVNCVEDHMHILLNIPPKYSISEIVQIAKGKSSYWINQQGFLVCLFRWQKGYGIFTVSRSAIPTVKSYIERQEEHHKNESFLSEYTNLLTKEGVVFDPQYIFHEPE